MPTPDILLASQETLKKIAADPASATVEELQKLQKNLPAIRIEAQINPNDAAHKAVDADIKEFYEKSHKYTQEAAVSAEAKKQYAELRDAITKTLSPQEIVTSPNNAINRVELLTREVPVVGGAIDGMVVGGGLAAVASGAIRLTPALGNLLLHPFTGQSWTDLWAALGGTVRDTVLVSGIGAVLGGIGAYFGMPRLQDVVQKWQKEREEKLKQEEKEKKEKEQKNENESKQALDKVLAAIPPNGTIDLNNPLLRGVTAESSPNLFALGTRTINVGGVPLRVVRVPAETGPYYFDIGNPARRFRATYTVLGTELDLGELAVSTQRMSAGGRDLLRVSADLSRMPDGTLKQVLTKAGVTGVAYMYIEEQHFAKVLANVAANTSNSQMHNLLYFAPPILGYDYFISAPPSAFSVGTPPVGVMLKTAQSVRFEGSPIPS